MFVSLRVWLKKLTKVVRSLLSTMSPVATHWNRKCLHFDDIIITGCTGSCLNDNFHCSQGWKFSSKWHFRFRVFVRFFMCYRGRVTHICVSKLTIIGSDNGLSPGRRQAIIWTNAGILLIGPLGANFCEILMEILTFSFKKMRFKVSSAKWRPFCLGLNGLNDVMHAPWKTII